MPRFTDLEASPETYFRSVILLGRNVASYKFALGHALLTLAGRGRTFVTLEELALEYLPPLLDHLERGGRQGTFANSRFLSTCRAYLQGEVTHEHLVDTAVRLGFANVIDAFHMVNQDEVPTRFYADDRRSLGGVTLTDHLLALPETAALQYRNLPLEIEARWRLVETAWDLGLPSSLISVFPDAERQELYVLDAQKRRRPLGRVRDALNGYQKGRCFYCGAPIGIGELEVTAEVDHVFPRVLMRRDVLRVNLDGVWNLVLSCRNCNRGEDGKSAHVPASHLVERLSRRNEHFIASHHPLRETLLSQLGNTEAARRSFLQEMEREALRALIFRWRPREEHSTTF